MGLAASVTMSLHTMKTVFRTWSSSWWSTEPVCCRESVLIQTVRELNKDDDGYLSPGQEADQTPANRDEVSDEEDDP